MISRGHQWVDQTWEVTCGGREIAALTFCFDPLSPINSCSLLLTRLSSLVHNPPSLPRGGGGVPQPSSLLPLLLLFCPLSFSSSSPLRALTRPSLILSRTLPPPIIPDPASLCAPHSVSRLVMLRQRPTLDWRPAVGGAHVRALYTNTGLEGHSCKIGNAPILEANIHFFMFLVF